MQSIAEIPMQNAREKRESSTPNAPKYYLYALPTSHTCVGSKACIQCVKDNALDTSFAVSQSGIQCSPIVKIINVTMLDVEKCPPWLIGTPTVYETDTRIVYKGQNALIKLEGIAKSDNRQYWISESEAKTINGGRTGARGAGDATRVSRPSALVSTSKGRRGMQSSRFLTKGALRGAQGAQGMGGSNALRGAWNAQKRLSADALASSMSDKARSRFGSGIATGGGDARRAPLSEARRSFSATTTARRAAGNTKEDGEAFPNMSTLRSAGDTSSTTAGNFALDPKQYDTAEAREAKIVSQKADAAAIGTNGGGMPGAEAPTSPVDLAAAFKKMQATRDVTAGGGGRI